jgi:glucosamine--fructose-6-phosphate aminotransferase (isomerizing)
MTDHTPLMLREAREAPARVADFIRNEGERVRELGARLRALDPPFVLTVGRGSSDHASLYARYLIETMLHVVTSSAAPSVLTAYAAPLKVAGAFVLSFSQSGASPDIVRVVEDARRTGALTAAFVNQPGSALGRAAELEFSLHAGDEKAIAATKSFLCTTAAAAVLTAAWAEDTSLAKALEFLPASLDRALQQDWSAGIAALKDADRTLIIARGRTLAIASEIALKLKEVAGIQAEAISAAEVLHGPMAVVDPSLPVVVLAIEDEAFPSVLSTMERLKEAGARLVVMSSSEEALKLASVPLPFRQDAHRALDPLVAVQAFYAFVGSLAQARGLNPDAPPHLAKVTRTL